MNALVNNTLRAALGVAPVENDGAETLPIRDQLRMRAIQTGVLARKVSAQPIASGEERLDPKRARELLATVPPMIDAALVDVRGSVFDPDVA